MSIYKLRRTNRYNPFTGRDSKPPPSSGEYCLRDSEGPIYCLGETCNLNRRTNEHIRKGKLFDVGTMNTKLPMGVHHSL